METSLPSVNSPSKYPVLMYHSICQSNEDAKLVNGVSVDLFRKHMHILSDNGYTPCDIDDFILWICGKKNLSDRSFLLTFDDGYGNFYHYAYPVLKSLKWPATVFIVTELLGKQSVWKNNNITAKQQLLSHTQIKEMSEHNISFHSHTCTHADLTKLRSQSLNYELIESRKHITELTNITTPYLAFPYGRHNKTVIETAKAAGYNAAFTVFSGFNFPGIDPFQIRRLDVRHTDTPKALLRKVKLGTNDGSLSFVLKYYISRVLAILTKRKQMRSI